MSTAKPGFHVLLAEPLPPHGPQERTRNLVGQRLSASCATVGQLRRNAVAVHGVKLGAAPDAPPWGKVLACLPPVPVRIQRRAVAARGIHRPPHHHTRQARSVHGGGKPHLAVSVLVPALGLASRGARCEWKASRKRPDGAGHGAGWRIAQLQVARPIGRSVTAGGSDRVCKSTRALGRTPRERHHRSDDRLLRHA